MIQAKFGLPGIALRTLEVYTTATLEAALGRPARDSTRAGERRWIGWRRRQAGPSARPSTRIRASRPTSAPPRRWRSSTRCTSAAGPRVEPAPEGLDRCARFPGSSRGRRRDCCSRRGSGAEELLKLDAADRETCRAMYGAWPFFRSSIDLLQMVLAKAEPAIAAHYDRQLVPPDLQGFGASLRARLQQAVDGVLLVTGQDRLLENNPVLRRSIDVRNPYVDPINLLQVELLRRLAVLHKIAAAARPVGRGARRRSGAAPPRALGHDQRHRGRDAEYGVERNREVPRSTDAQDDDGMPGSVPGSPGHPKAATPASDAPSSRHPILTHSAPSDTGRSPSSGRGSSRRSSS